MVGSYLKYVFAAVVIAAVLYMILTSMTAFTSEAFGVAVGAVIPMVFQLLPWIKKDYDALNPDQQNWVHIILLLLLVAGSFGLSCAVVVVAFACTTAGAGNALLVFVMALGTNIALRSAGRYGQETVVPAVRRRL